MQISSIRVGTLVHAYRQAPWRIQRQWMGTFLLVVLGVAMVSSLYLDVTAQAAISGREIQSLTTDIIVVQQTNADLQTRLAQLTSHDAMQKRAEDLGYEAVDPAQIQYVVVPGYAAPQVKILSVAPALRPSAPSIPPEYTQSLIEWLQDALRPAPGLSLSGASQ
ncbi:MAG: hypothetical protein ACM3MF_05305 [Anaerolineae bacterium]